MTSITTEVTDLLGINYPILQGAMGPRGTVRLAYEVSNAGGLGTISNMGANVDPEEAEERWTQAFDRVCSNTDRPFGANLPLGYEEYISKSYNDTVEAFMKTAFRIKETDDRAADQFIVMTTYGGDPNDWHDEITETGLLHFAKVTSVEEAEAAEEIGVDAVIASGFEMGGHTHPPDRAMHTFVLVPAVVEAVDIPVIAAGGIRNGKGMLAALAMGADAVSMGTRFIATEEAEDFHSNLKEYVVESGEGENEITEGLFGPSLRRIVTPGFEELQELKADESVSVEEFAKIRAKKGAAGRDGDVTDGVVPGGQVAAYVNDIPSVQDLLDRMVHESIEQHHQISEYLVES